MIELRFRTDPRAIADNLRATPAAIDESIHTQMLREVISLQTYVRTSKLQGSPLHQRSGNLNRSVLTEVEVNGNTISGTLGVDKTAPYGKVHELGGTFSVREHLRMSIRGKQFTVKEHEATFPERSFLRSSLTEREEAIRANLTKAAEQGVRP